MKKILVCITARPSYSRVKTVIQALQSNHSLEVSVIASGSALLERYGRVVDLIRADGIQIEEEIHTFVEGSNPSNMAITTALTTEASARAFARLQPDLIVTVADRYETLGSAIAASYSGIPLAHIQGGEVTGNIDERVRHAVTKLSDLHFVANSEAANRIRRMGESPDNIFVTGCPSIDLVKGALRIELDAVQTAVDSIGVGADVDITKDFSVVMQHPETEKFLDSYDQMLITLDAAEKIGLPILIFWPNVDAGSDSTSKAIRVMRENGGLKKARIIKNLEGQLFLKLLSCARFLAGNSSVGIRESGYLGVPVINIGSRQRNRLSGSNVTHICWQPNDIYQAMREQLAVNKYPENHIYGDGASGERIADVISHWSNSSPKIFCD